MADIRTPVNLKPVLSLSALKAGHLQRSSLVPTQFLGLNLGGFVLVR
jgi:hypothetical protein